MADKKTITASFCTCGDTSCPLNPVNHDLGCTLAYNLDGGQTSLLAFGNQLVNDPSDGGRSSSDYIMIVDRIEE